MVGLTIGTYIPNATFILKDSDGFYKDLLDTWGIEQSWIKFDRRRMKTSQGGQFVTFIDQYSPIVDLSNQMLLDAIRLIVCMIEGRIIGSFIQISTHSGVG